MNKNTYARLALILVLALMTLVGCGEKEPEFTGEWKLAGFYDGSEYYTLAEYETLSGIDFSKSDLRVLISVDGNFKTNIFGEMQLGEWRQEGDNYYLSLDGTEEYFEYRDGAIYYDSGTNSEGVTSWFVFKK